MADKKKSEELLDKAVKTVKSDSDEEKTAVEKTVEELREYNEENEEKEKDK
ncbi:hypothetical protein [Jeotgalibacillus soli]|uniref:Uncharacterized protein n=1 Tax=Jeotgalibacillus soli TaxID=889306 RepID=A0A0C2W088_9BACL|nr:hypothetical protein [Jeotgalibacillus soli]KIL49598.1 hypothetical protein KP78_10660 [Jeotgalibacillus soli]